MESVIRIPLRTGLTLDAVVTGMAGLVLLAVAGPLEDLLDLSATLLRVCGVMLVPWAGLVGLVARQKTINPVALRGIIVVNALWTIASFVVLLSGAVEPNGLGVAFMLFQAIVVALFAAHQAMSLWRMPPEPSRLA